MRAMLDAVRRRSPTTTVSGSSLIASAGDRIFCAGADLAVMAD